MFSTIKAIIKKKLDKKMQEYIQKDFKDLSKLINRPNEGEIVKISNIKIHKYFKEPGQIKMRNRKIYYNEHDYYKKQIVLDANNYLVDGYTTYLLAKEKGFEYITIVREK